MEGSGYLKRKSVSFLRRFCRFHTLVSLITLRLEYHKEKAFSNSYTSDLGELLNLPEHRKTARNIITLPYIAAIIVTTLTSLKFKDI